MIRKTLWGTTTVKEKESYIYIKNNVLYFVDPKSDKRVKVPMEDRKEAQENFKEFDTSN